MRIDRLEFRTIEIPRREAFAIARGTSTTATNTFVRVEADRLEGWGAAAPSSVTDETPETVEVALGGFASGLREVRFERPRELADEMDRILPGNPSAKAAVDLAFHDLLATEAGAPLHRFLGSTRDRIVTDRTVGILETDAAVERAREYVAQGFRALKVKVGTDAAKDRDRIAAIREAVGRDVALRVDGNEGFDREAARAIARVCADLGVEFLEQPLRRTDLEGMQDLTAAARIPIMADEMVVTSKDAMTVRWGACASAVNLKLMKHGGFVRAADVDTVCESAGFPTMVGCNSESVVSIAAGLHFALSRKNVRWVDLDSHFNLTRDVAEPLRFEDGRLIAPTGPGLGLKVDLDRAA